MSTLEIVGPIATRVRKMPAAAAHEARSRASRKAWQTRLLQRAIAGDREAGIQYAFYQLDVSGKLRQRCEYLFAAGAHLNPIEDAAAVVHAAQLELQATAHQDAMEQAARRGQPVQEWRAKQAAYCAQAALRALQAIRLTPSSRKPVSNSPEGRRRQARASAADLEQYR